jgi:hypothetical protein
MDGIRKMQGKGPMIVIVENFLWDRRIFQKILAKRVGASKVAGDW